MSTRIRTSAVATLVVITVAIAVPSIADAQPDDLRGSIDEIVRFVNDFFWAGIGWPLVLALVAWLVVLFVLVARNSAGSVRSAAAEWALLLAIPLLVGGGTLYAVSAVYAERVPENACDELEHETDIESAQEREIVRRGVELCKVAEDGDVALMFVTGGLPLTIVLGVAFILTVGLWVFTNSRLVTGRYAT